MNLTDFLERYSIPYRKYGEHHHCRENWINCDCPYCGRGTERWHMGINLTYHYVNCWRCGHHRLADSLAEAARISVGQVLKELEGLKSERRSEQKHTGTYKSPKGMTGTLLTAHQKYLRRRGFDWEELQKLWRIEGTGPFGRLAWRIFIPVIFQGEPVSWMTRAIGKVERRYISARPSEESIPRKNLLYGWDYVRHSVVVCEGPTDVWKIGPGAVATMSTQFTPSQVEMLSKIPKRIICFDNEVPAQKRAKALRDQLSGFPGETINVRLDSNDPGSASPGEIAELRKLLS